MKNKTNWIILLILPIAFNAFGQDSLQVKKHSDLLRQAVELSINENIQIAKPIVIDKRFPLNFPKFIYKGNTEKDIKNYQDRITAWKKENPTEAKELFKKRNN